MYRPGSSPPATRVQRSRFGPIDSSRGFGSRSRSPSPRGRHHRSPPSRRSSHRFHRSPSPRRFNRTYSLDQPSYSPRQHSRSPRQRSGSSVEKYLRNLIENGTSSTADNLSNVNRDDSSDGPIFSRALSHPWNPERGFFHEENSSRLFSMGHDKDYYNRDIFRAQLDRSINSELLQDQSRENNRGGEQESKYFQYDRKDRLFGESIKSQALLAETEKYHKQSLSLMYVDEDFHKLERIRRKREENLQRRNIRTDYPIPDSANQEQTSESRHHYRSEKTPAVPLKSILKKRSDDSSTQDSGNFSKEKEPPESTLESVNQHGDFLLPYERASQDGSGFSDTVGIMIDSTYTPDKRLDPFPYNIEDEEKFLYGDDDGESNNCLPSQKLMLSEKKEPVSEKVNSPPPASLSVKPEILEQSSPEYDKIRDLLKTIGLDIGVAEVGKLAARTEERLYGKKPTCSPDHHSVANHKAELWKRQKHSPSPFDSFPSAKANNITKLGQNNPTGICEQSDVPGFLIPSAPPSFLDIPPGPTSASCQNVPYVSTFTPNRFFPNSASLPVVLPNYDVYQRHMDYATSDWCAQKVNSVCPNKPEVANLARLKRKYPNPNLRIINTTAISKNPSQVASTMVRQRIRCKKKVKRGKCDEKNQTPLMQMIIKEREALTCTQISQQKRLFYQKIELDRLSEQQVTMLLKKGKKEDPLLMELSKLKENLAKQVAQLEMSINAIKEKQGELNKAAHILETNAFEKSETLSSENKDSSENNLQNNLQSEERTFDSVKS